MARCNYCQELGPAGQHFADCPQRPVGDAPSLTSAIGLFTQLMLTSGLPAVSVTWTGHDEAAQVEVTVRRPRDGQRFGRGYLFGTHQLRSDRDEHVLQIANAFLSELKQFVTS